MPGKAAPRFGAERLLVVATGAVNAMHLPFWLNWVSANYPALNVRVVLTRSAQQFVSPHSISLLTRNEVLTDVWTGEPAVTAPHVDLVEWADAVAVFPASLNFVGRLAAGLGDTPALLALQICRAPVGIAPSLPPGAEDNPLVRDNLRRLTDRPNVAVAPTRPSRSLTTGERDAAGSVPLWDLLPLIEELRTDPAGTVERPAPHA